MQDVQNRQRSGVFPQTLANETRLWRNILNGKATPLTWIGLAVLGISILAFVIAYLKILNDDGGLLQGALETLLVFGPIFGLIAWATRRNLRKLESSRHKSRQEKL
jgi:FtsH-binding integral membrane protein